MTQQDSTWIIRRKQKREQKLGYVIVIALLSMSAFIAYGL